MLVQLTKRFDPYESTLAACREYVGGISQVSKGERAWYSASVTALSCRIGSRLRGVEGSSCFKCYAFNRGNYRYPVVKQAQQRRLEAISRPHWAATMTRLISHYSDEYFRWHDSGDIVDLTHLIKIVQVANNLPDTLFWLPTRETNTLRAYREQIGAFPTNLAVRISAYMVDTAPPRFSGLLDLPTSTINKTKGEHYKTKGSIECKAYTRGGACGPCRACWDVRVSNVSYPQH